MRHTVALGVAAVLPLSACAPQIPEINYDDPAALHTELPKPVKIVQMPELLPLPSQLKRMPRGQPARALEPGDPVRRVQLANAAASVKPTRAGYVNAIQVYPYRRRRAVPALRRPGARHRYRLEPGEELKAVAAGDTTQWKIGDTESGSGATRQAHLLVKPISADLPMNKSSSRPTAGPIISKRIRPGRPTWPRSPGAIRKTSSWRCGGRMPKPKGAPT